MFEVLSDYKTVTNITIDEWGGTFIFFKQIIKKYRRGRHNGITRPRTNRTGP